MYTSVDFLIIQIKASEAVNTYLTVDQMNNNDYNENNVL